MRGHRSTRSLPTWLADSSSSEHEPQHSQSREHFNPYFPDDLREALQNISQTTTPHVGSACDLPQPGLRVANIDELIGLPLTAHQAERLVNHAELCPHGRGQDTVIDPSVRDCLQIDTAHLTFTNPKWEPAISKLVTEVAEAFGLPVGSIRASLYKLLLYRTGGHFKPHRDTEKEPGMFATLSIQLPSDFRGGEFVITHKDKSIIYHGGTKDGSCKFQPYYTAFFADVEHEIRPVTHGYRLALVYNLAWERDGTPPNASGDVSNVEYALTEYAKKKPVGAWILAYGLEHKYTKLSLSTFGARALKGADRRNVAAIREASLRADMGDVEVALCLLTRSEIESGDSVWGRFEVADTYPGEVCAQTMYNAKGKLIRDELKCIDWDLASSDLKLAFERRGEVEITGNEGATRNTTYGGLGIAIWPKNKDIEIKCANNENITPFLTKAPKHIIQERIDRLLTYNESVGPSGFHPTAQAESILVAAHQNGEMSQVSRALKFASKVDEMPRIEEKIGQIITKRGWTQCEAIVTDFLCNRNAADMTRCDSIVRTLSMIVQKFTIPAKLVLDVLRVVIAFVEAHKRFFVPSDRTGSTLFFLGPVSWLADAVDQWSLLLNVIEKTRKNSVSDEEKETIDTLTGHLALLIDNFSGNELKYLEKALEKGSKTGPYSFPVAQLEPAVTVRRKKLQLNRFIEEADSIIEKKEVKTENRLLASLQEPLPDECGVFVKLACTLLSADDVDKTVQAKFDAALAAFPSLPKEDMALLMRQVAMARSSGMHEPTIMSVKQAIESTHLSREEKSLREQIQNLEAATTVKPENVQVRYPGPFNSGIAEIERFMASDQMLRVVKGFNSVVVARKVLRSFESKLPTGMQAMAAGHGRHSFIRLQKPFSHERDLWLKYKNNVAELETAKKKLNVILKKANSRPSTSQGPAKRLKTENGEAQQAEKAGSSAPGRRSVAKKEENLL